MMHLCRLHFLQAAAVHRPGLATIPAAAQHPKHWHPHHSALQQGSHLFAPRIAAAATAAAARERVTRVKVSHNQQHAGSAAADADSSLLDELYGADEAQQEHEQQQQQCQQQQQHHAPAATPGGNTAAASSHQPAPSAAADQAVLAASVDDLLDSIYTAEAQLQPAAPPELPARVLSVVAAAAAIDSGHEAAAGGSSAVQAAADQANAEHAAAASTRQATDTDGLLDIDNADRVSDISAGDGTTAAAVPGRSSSPAAGRVPPTRISAPDPPDLQAFNNGVLLVDKPKGWTSFDVCNAIKKPLKQLGVKKVGHAGTLDPAATGLLIVCTGAGTKSIESFMAAHKEYSGTIKLGEGTPSLDAETEVEETKPWEHITDEELQEAARKLTGDIKQVPPMYSALHHQGQRLHELARAGVTVEREARPVTITRFDVHRDATNRQLIHFYVGCSKGTYIRTLGHDLATSLGSTGHLVALRREAIGDAGVGQAWDIKQLVDKMFAAIKEQPPGSLPAVESRKRGQRHNQGSGKGRGQGSKGGGV